MNVEFKDNGYLILPAKLVEQYFPARLLLAFCKEDEMWLLPVRGAGAGGLLLKQRNLQGDCSVLIWELFPEGMPQGKRKAVWDAERGALRVKVKLPESTLSA